MQPDDALGPLRRAGDLVDVERRGVGCEHSVRLADLVEPLEDLLLDAHLLEGRLDDDVGAGDRLIARRLADQRQALRLVFGADAALLHHVLIVLIDACEAAVERFRRAFEDLNRDAGIGEAHGDAAAHRAGADHRGRRELARLHRGIDVGHLRRLALGEEGVAQGLRLLRGDQLADDAHRLGDRFVEGQGDRVLDTIDDALRGYLAAILLRCRGARIGEQRAPVALGARDRHLAQAADRRLVGDDALREGDGLGQQIALGDGIENAELLRLGAAHRVARHHHLQRRLEADETR